MHQNVILNLFQCFVLGAANSIWTGTVQVVFIYIMCDESNTSVGMVEMAYGLASLISAYPIGYIADKRGRSPLLKVGGAVAILTAVATAYTVWCITDDDPKWGYTVFITCMVLWGIVGGITNGPAQALYADSIPDGTRSKWFNRLFSSWLVGSAVGPMITVIMFREYGNRWHLPELRMMFIVGLALEVVGSIPSFFYKDIDRTKKEKVVQNIQDVDAAIFFLDKNKWYKAIPYVLVLSNTVVALGSGMTVKFFPLFFKNTLDMSPSAVQIIYTVSPIAITLFSGLGICLAKRTGRIEAVLLLSFIGLGFLVSMALFYRQLTPIGTAVFFVIRTALMNSPTPLYDSILMDTVPKSQRARWKSLDSIIVLGWCGSAALGGWLADSYNYTTTFLITAIVQATGLLLLLIIRRAVPNEETEKLDDESAPLL
jgi:MFS family permease